ncbi:MAG: hypothetical protein OIF58_16170 [Cohaesibacter sp.]|nr:hypothetical protein [Cohaesibacter sp.]
MTLFPSLFKRAASLILCGLTLAACQVVGSHRVSVSNNDSNLGCVSHLGSYSLPKGVVKFSISKTTTTGKAPTFSLDELRIRRIPDHKHTFCLDHMVNHLSDDDVWVRKSYQITADNTPIDGTSYKKGATIHTPFLQLVASSAFDQSVVIVRKIINAVFQILSNNGSFANARSTDLTAQDTNKEIVANMEFDPFNPHELAEINQSIRQHGFCFILSDYSYNTSETRGISAARYCNQPQKMARLYPSAKMKRVREQAYLKEKPNQGIFFRPRASYRLLIYTNDDPNGRTGWGLSAIQSIDLENISPILSVDVSRAWLAQQKVALIFNDGQLQDACIARGSQVANVVQIPLEIIYGVIALPSQRIVGAIQNTKSRVALVDAQQKLIQAQQDYINHLADPQKFPVSEAYDATKLKGAPLKLGVENTGDDNLGVPNPESNKPTNITFNTTELTGKTEFHFGDNGPFGDICNLLQGRFGKTLPGNLNGSSLTAVKE